jgi:hypothetical protein
MGGATIGLWKGIVPFLPCDWRFLPKLGAARFPRGPISLLAERQSAVTQNCVAVTGNFFCALLQMRKLRFATRFLVGLCLAAPVSAQPRLSAADCARVVAHLPDASVAYRPGADVLGRPVAPADLSPPQLVAPPRLGFMLSVDLARRLDLPMGLSGDLPLGIVTIENNQLRFNGRVLGDETQAALAAACSAARR